MANTHSIEVHGIPFGPDEVFGPATLRHMFGATLPRHFRIARDGSVPVHTVVSHLQRQGEAGLRAMLDESETVTPGTPEALAEF